MNKVQLLQSIWESFGIPAYDESSVPAKATMPYITYNFASGDFGFPVSLNASVWYRSSSWKEISLKVENIIKAINSKPIYTCEDGAILVTLGNPNYIRTPDEDDSVRHIVINYEVEFIN